jgi:hypothetical protein
MNKNYYCIPLWHHELVYDNSGSDIYVKCNPILDENENVVYTDLVSLAIWIPETIGKDIIRQPENI